MKISLIQAEIHQALVDFIAKKGIDTNGKISIDITVGRKENGVSAEIDIDYNATAGKVEKTYTNECCGSSEPVIKPVPEAPAPWVDEAKEEVTYAAEPEEAKADKPLFGN